MKIKAPKIPEETKAPVRSEISPDNRHQSNETPLLMSWSLKTLALSPSSRTFSLLLSFGAPGIVLAYILWLIDLTTVESYGFPISITIGFLLVSFAMLAALRQKTLFNYRVYPDHIEYDACLYYPDYTEDLLKGMVIIFVLATIFLGIFTGSPLLAIFGPIFILAGTGGALMSWQRPVPRCHPSLPWDDINFITVDRKYRIIVQHTTHLTLGFEARFPDDDLFEQYLAFLRTVLRPTVTYTEKIWHRR